MVAHNKDKMMIHSDLMITYSSGLIETDNGEKAEKVVESYSEHAVAGSESSPEDNHLARERLLWLVVVAQLVVQSFSFRCDH